MVLSQKIFTIESFWLIGQDLWTPSTSHYEMTLKNGILHEIRRWSKILLTLNLGQYLAKVVLHVREALPHRPRYVLPQRKAFLDVFDHSAKTKNLVLYSPWGFFWRRMSFSDFWYFWWFSSLQKRPNLGRKAFLIDSEVDVGPVDGIEPKSSQLKAFGRLAKTFEIHQPPLMKSLWKMEFCMKSEGDRKF